MSGKLKVDRFLHRTDVDGVLVESTVLRPEGGRYALDEVFKPLPGGGTVRLTPRSRSYLTLDELDEDVRAEVRTRPT